MTRLIDLDALPKDWQVEDIVFAPEVDAIPIAHIQRRIEELKPMAAFEWETGHYHGCFFYALQEEEKLVDAWEKGMTEKGWLK